MTHHWQPQLQHQPPEPAAKQDAVSYADEMQRPQEPEWSPTVHEKLIIYTLAATGLVVALDASIIVTPLNAIAIELRATSTEAFWIGTSYLLVNAVTMPFICSVSDVFGRPICLTFSLLAFTLGTIFCATAHNIVVMLVGRSVQGVGGAGIHALGLVVQCDIVPLRYRPKWYGITLASWALGLTSGPIIGGAISERTTWRWIFYIMFPILALGLVAVPTLLTIKPKKLTLRERLAKIDWIGGAIFTGSATSFLIAVSWGGTQYPWDSYQTLVPLVVGFAGLVGTILYERHVPKYPLLRWSLFHNASSIVTYVLAAVHGMLLYGYLYYLAFYFLSVKGYSALISGIVLLPVMIPLMLSSIVAGCLVTRFNNFRWPICIGWFVGTIGAGLTIVWGTNDSIPVWVITLIFLGLGQGVVLNAQNFASQAICRTGDEAAAAAMYAFARQFGAALGVGVGGTIFQNVLGRKLGLLNLPVDIAKHAESYVPTLKTLPEGDLRAGITDAYLFGFLGVYEVYLGLSGVALILCVVFLKNVTLNKELDSEHQLDGSRLDMFADGGVKKDSPSPSSSVRTSEIWDGGHGYIHAHESIPAVDTST